MAEIGRRDRGVAHGDKVRPVYASFGNPVTGIMLVNAPGASDVIQPAGVFSTAGYTAPPQAEMEPLKEGRFAKLCAWEDKTCRAYATRTGYCVGHSKSKGLL